MKKLSMLMALAVFLFTACQNTDTNAEASNASVNVSPSKKETTDNKTVAVAEKISGYKIGDVATDFSLKNVDGQMVSLADYKDAKGYIVTFTCNHCPYAKMYEQRLIELHNNFSGKGYPVVAINPNDPDVVPEDSFENMQRLAKEKKYPFAYLIDADQKLYPKYGATKTPHIFLLNEKREVKYIGAMDNSPRSADDVTEKYVEDAIAALMKGKNPDPAETKAIGCSVKCKK